MRLENEEQSAISDTIHQDFSQNGHAPTPVQQLKLPIKHDHFRYPTNALFSWS